MAVEEACSVMAGDWIQLDEHSEMLEVTATDHSPERSRLTVRSTHRPIWVLEFLPDDPVFVVCLFDLSEVSDDRDWREPWGGSTGGPMSV